MPQRNRRQIIERVLLTPARLASLLQKSKVRITDARMDVLLCLVNSSRPLTHLEIAAQLPQYDASTIFRGLIEFANNGIAWRIETGETDRFYEVADFRFDGETCPRHAHFLCLKCGELRCLRQISLDKENSFLTENSGDQLIDMLIKGLCRHCQNDAT